MPKRDEAPIGAPCWVDLFTADTTKIKAFYGELFGWTAEDSGPEFGGYINFSKDGVMVAGCMHNDGQMGTPDHWSVYLATDDARKTADAAAAEGGQVIVPPMDVGELGTMAVLIDAGGAAIGLWQPGLHRGFGVLDEPGAPSWFELHTREYDASLAFYRSVFRWDTHTVGDTDDFRYTTLGENESALAGVMDASQFLPEGMPSTWAIYFATADVDASVAKIVGLGGAIVEPAEDTPYGRLAGATDPTGSYFKLRGPNTNT
jgi:uncharacterized protein